MKYNEINKRFTECVAELMSRGYYINSQSMSGGSGEIAKVDLTNGESTYRVCLESSYHLTFDERVNQWRGRAILLRVAYTQEVADRYTYWKDFLIADEIIFYEIEEGKWYTDSLHDALEAQRLHRMRAYNHRENTSFEYLKDDKRKAIAGNYLKRKYGYQRIRWGKVSILKTTADTYTSYRVSYLDHLKRLA